MKSFKTVDQLDSMKSLGNEGFLDWINDLWGNIIQSTKDAFNKVLSKKNSFTVDIDQVAKKYKMGNEDGGMGAILFLGGLFAIYIILSIIAEFKKDSGSSGENVFDKIDAKLKTRGNELTRLPEADIKEIAHKYTGYAALLQDVKATNLTKNYWKSYYTYKDDYLALPTFYDVDDSSMLIKNVNNLDNWSFSLAVIELANRFNNNGKITIDKDIINNIFSGISYYYGGMMSNVSNNTFFTRIKKVLDKPLVPADLYYVVDLYEEFIYYWVKIESETKYSFGLASSPYKRDNEYSKKIITQIKSSNLNRINNALNMGSMAYWHWFNCLFGGETNQGYLSEFYKSYGVNPKENYGTMIYVKVANYLLDKKGVFNNPNLNKEMINILYETLIGLACSYNSDLTKRKLYKNNCTLDDETKLILAENE